MIIVEERPPNYQDIIKVFPSAKNRGVIFTYGEYLYNPDGVYIGKGLKAHEGLHGEQQEKYGVEQWWEDYLDSLGFRFHEELMAHRAEYQAELGYGRRYARQSLKSIAKRFSSPLYGNFCTYEKARKLIQNKDNL